MINCGHGGNETGAAPAIVVAPARYRLPQDARSGKSALGWFGV